MNTKNVIDSLKKFFHVSNYWLEKFLDVHHSLFLKYSNGTTEARFSEVFEWLNKFNLCIIKDKFYFSTNLHKPLNELPNWVLTTKFNSILDNEEWKNYGEKEERKNGHIIFWAK